MPRYKTPIDQLLREEDVSSMLSFATEQKWKQDALLICMCWKTGARTHEISELKKEDFKIFNDKLQIRLHTEKKGESNSFILRERTLEFARPRGVELDLYVENIVQHVEELAPGQPFFDFGDRWMQKRLNIIGLKVLGREVCVYHFRHSAMTREAGKGHGTPDLMHFKGAKNPRSVDGYLHATPYVVK